MDFFTFVLNIQQNALPSGQSVFCLVGDYPVYFFSQLLQSGSSELPPIQKITVDQENEQAVIGQLTTTFLGQTSLFWITNLPGLPTQKKKEFVTFLTRYSGPHTVVVCVDEKGVKQVSNTKIVQVEIPTVLTSKQVQVVCSLLYPTAAQALYKKIVASGIRLERSSLDTICMVLSYFRLIGGSVDEFKREWYSKLIAPETSLFTLSTHFFARKQQPFFTLWLQVKDDYAPQFWIAFWSDQLIKAYGYVLYSQQNNHLAAKKMGYRLPFSFMKTDWKKHSLKKLAATHDQLYALDFHMKNGGTDQFELLYAQFFTQY